MSTYLKILIKNNNNFLRSSTQWKNLSNQPDIQKKHYHEK